MRQKMFNFTKQMLNQKKMYINLKIKTISTFHNQSHPNQKIAEFKDINKDYC